MFRVSTVGDTSEIEMRNPAFKWGAIFFLALGALDVVLAFVGPRPTDLIGPGLGCLIVGVLWGLSPNHMLAKVDRTQGELVRTSRTLFSRSVERSRLDDLESLTIIAGTYYWCFYVKRKSETPWLLFRQMKLWTFSTVPTAAVLARGEEIAKVIGVPLQQPA